MGVALGCVAPLASAPWPWCPSPAPRAWLSQPPAPSPAPTVHMHASAQVERGKRPGLVQGQGENEGGALGDWGLGWKRIKGCGSLPSSAPWSPSAATVHTRRSGVACGQWSYLCTACALALHMHSGRNVCALRVQCTAFALYLNCVLICCIVLFALTLLCFGGTVLLAPHASA